MSDGPLDYPVPMEPLNRALRRAGVRLTPQRIEIYREVASRQDHPDVETIYTSVRRRMPGVSLDTVYRTLQLFVNLGLVGTLNLPRERAHYDANMRRHHHFVCTICGSARDFYSEAFDRIALPEEATDLGTVRTAHVELRGICPRCAKSERPAQEQSPPRIVSERR